MAVEPKGYLVQQNDDDAFRLDDDADCRIVDGAIHMRVVTSYGDPVELTAKEARMIAAALSAFADKLDVELDIVPVASAATPDLPQPAQPKKPAPAAVPSAKKH
jgi:hypothetical protein